jgi:hypothetical protein
MALIVSNFFAVVAFLFSVFNGADAGRRSQNNNHWVDTRVTMPQLVEPANLPNPPFVSATPDPFISVADIFFYHRT